MHILQHLCSDFIKAAVWSFRIRILSRLTKASVHCPWVEYSSPFKETKCSFVSSSPQRSEQPPGRQVLSLSFCYQHHLWQDVPPSSNVMLQLAASTAVASFWFQGSRFCKTFFWESWFPFRKEEKKMKIKRRKKKKTNMPLRRLLNALLC